MVAGRGEYNQDEVDVEFRCETEIPDELDYENEGQKNGYT